MAGEEYEKILFQLYGSVLDEETIEKVWAVIVDEEKDLYKLDRILSYSPNVAANDIIYEEFDEDQERPSYRHTVEASGNSTVQIVNMDSETVRNEVREVFDLFVCSSEKYSEVYFVIDVSNCLNCSAIYNRLKSCKMLEFSIMQSSIYLKSTGWSKL